MARWRVPIPGFGKKLQRERERRGLQLAEVARDINVGPQLLEALENDDLAALPGGPFNKGIVRAYARRLALDPEETIRRYGREERACGLNSPDADHQPRQRRVEIRDEGERSTLVIDWHLARAVLAVSIVLVAGAGVLGYLSLRGPDAAAAGRESATAPPAEPPTARTTLPVSGPTEPERPAARETQRATTRKENGIPRVSDDPSISTAGAGIVEPPAPGPDTPTPEAPRATANVAKSTTSHNLPASVEPALPPRDMRVSDAGVGLAVEDDAAVTGRGPFRAGDRVWFWTRTENARGATLEHVWLREGRVVERFTLDVAGTAWRNASYKTLWDTSAGRWTVEARDTEGRVLARREFVCVSDDDERVAHAAPNPGT